MIRKSMYALGCISFLLCCTLQAKESFIVGGWIPYWKTDSGTESVREHISHFNELSPFSYEVDAQGGLVDRFSRRQKEWDDFFDYCKQKKLKLIPTIFWTDTQAIHAMLAQKETRNNHINQLIAMVKAKKFKGLNLNYERVNAEDRDAFLDFIQELSKKLHAQKLEFHFTIEGRTSDTTFHLLNEQEAHDSIGGASNPSRTLPNRRYKTILSQCCDRVIIMAYDEWGEAYRYSPANLKNKYYLSHSSKQWVEQIIKYMRSFLPARKLVLGLPTYGLEFAISTAQMPFAFKKVRSPTYQRALEIAKEYNCKPHRTAGGELSFTYKDQGEERYVCYTDSTFIKERIALAKKHKLKGIYLFKIDGAEDKTMWRYLLAAVKS